MKFRITSMLVAALLLTGATVTPFPATDNLQPDAATTETLPVALVENSTVIEEPILLTSDEAATVALARESLTADQVKGLKAEQDVDDGVKVYEIEFRSGDYEYDYTIHAESGKILSRDKEYDPVETKPKATEPKETEPKATEPTTEPATEPDVVLLTANEAKAIALAHAGVSTDTVKGLRAEYDEDDGVKVYEVEFRSGKYEYEYEINAESGKIISSDKEKDD